MKRFGHGMQISMFVSASGFHYNVFLELITISNTRSERANEHITTLCTCQQKNMYTCKLSCLLGGVKSL